MLMCKLQQAEEVTGGDKVRGQNNGSGRTDRLIF